MAYISLREKSRYLHSITTQGANRELRDDEITKCEGYADTLIEGYLGKSWDFSAPPEIIEQVADLLASSKAWQFLHTGQSPKQSEYAEGLRKEAIDLISEIRAGKIGIKMADGTWDEDYSGTQNKEEKAVEDMEIIL